MIFFGDTDGIEKIKIALPPFHRFTTHRYRLGVLPSVYPIIRVQEAYSSRVKPAPTALAATNRSPLRVIKRGIRKL